ncbi:F-actin-capping protein subunit beta [Tulasnella sp. 331]|nr:F-actin-capping protein subunit beta [Tulasnella sp. 331]
MGKEKQVIGELLDVLESVRRLSIAFGWTFGLSLPTSRSQIAGELWPPEKAMDLNGSGDETAEEEEDLDKQLANELAAIRKPHRPTQRFRNIFVDTKCLAFISCRPPVDPVKLVLAYFEEIERTKQARTRNVLRLSPVTGTCAANQPEILSLARNIFPSVFECVPSVAHRYKIQCRVRNNHKFESQALVPELAKCVPSDHGHKVDLENPEMVILVEVYQPPFATASQSSSSSSTEIHDALTSYSFISTLPVDFPLMSYAQEGSGDTLESMLDLMRRLPPTRIEENVQALIQLVPDFADEFLGCVDQPLKVRLDKTTGREFLTCDYNRDGESYRSPWSNEYDPPLEDGTVPSAKLRKLEIQANEAFDAYREMYYEGGGVSSVFLWDLEDGGFAGVVLLKKAPTGSWDSIHVFETSERGRTAHYKLTSTVMLQMVSGKSQADPSHKPKDGEWNNTKEDNVDLSGSMTRQAEADAPVTDSSSHIVNTGRMIEDMEIKMRNLLQEVYFGKTRDIVFDLRSVDSLEKARRQKDLQKELVGMMQRKKPSS